MCRLQRVVAAVLCRSWARRMLRRKLTRMELWLATAVSRLVGIRGRWASLPLSAAPSLRAGSAMLAWPV